MPSWDRKRQPDDVPTPVAVAVSDFCRRAGAPAAPRTVREALSALSDADDDRVRAVTDAEPPGRPLGPYAVVDLARGTAPDLVMLRERSGYYGLAAELLASGGGASARPASSGTEAALPAHAWAEPSRGATPAPDVGPAAPGGWAEQARAALAAAADARFGVEAPPTPEPVATPVPPRAAERRAKEPAPAPLTVAERIAPRRRTATEAAARAQPRGRFTQMETQRAPIERLAEPDARSELEALVAQHGHRPALLRALAHGYTGRHGEPTLAELDEVLAAQDLDDRVDASERTLVLASISEQRGAVGRVAWALGLRPAELQATIARLGLGPEVERMREHFRRQALAPAHWTQRLDLLGRRKYLQDLGLDRAFEEQLRRDLAAELARTDPAAPDRLTTLARHLGVAPELLRRTLERLGLTAEASASTSP